LFVTGEEKRAGRFFPLFLLLGLTPRYHLPELPRLNKSKIGFNWAGGAGRSSQMGTDYQVFKNEKNYLRQIMRPLL